MKYRFTGKGELSPFCVMKKGKVEKHGNILFN